MQVKLGSFDGVMSGTIVPGTLRRRAAMAGLAVTALTAVCGSPRAAPAAEPAMLRIGGTGMALATMRQVGEAFAAIWPEATVEVLPSLGTGGGLAAVTAGAIDLALSARALTDAERAKGLQSFAYARTPVAFATNPTVGIHGITLAEAARILGGSMSAWPDGTPIRLVRREPSDADWAMLRALSADMAEAVTAALSRPGLLTVATDQENADALERMRGSFGAISIGQMLAEARHVAPLALDGEAPELEGLAAGRYRLSRTLHVVWRDRPSPDVERFLAFLHARQASELLLRLGHIPPAGPGAGAGA
jgi:phosphate transport system substrate-binding protein